MLRKLWLFHKNPITREWCYAIWWINIQKYILVVDIDFMMVNNN